MSAAPTVTRFVLFEDSDATFEETAAWGPWVAEPITHWDREGNHQRELLEDLPAIVARLAPGETFDDFFKWMVEHCRSAVFTARHEHGTAIADGGMVFEYMIAEENQAYHFRTRWT